MPRPATGERRRGAGPRLVAALGAAVVLLAGAGEAAGQARPDSAGADTLPRLLDELVIRGTRPVATTGGSSALRVRPDSLRTSPAPTLAQVLRELPFVGVRENSRGEAEITLRGSESRQVAVVVDGVPITLGWDSRTDPSVVPLTGARSLLVVRGLHSLLYGPNVLGGVVEVGVAGGEEEEDAAGREVRVRAGADHVGGHSVSATAGGGAEAGGVALSLRGGVGYRDRPGLPLAGGITNGASELRTNSDARQADAFAALRARGGAGQWLGLSLSGYRGQRGVTPELHLESPRLWRYPRVKRTLAVLSAGTGWRGTPAGTGDLEASVGVDAGSTEIHSYESLAYRRVTGTEQADDRTLTLRLIGDHSLPLGASLRGAWTVAETRHLESLNGAPELRYRQRLWSGGAEATAPLGGATRVSGGLVLDGASTPESGDKPALGALRSWGGRLGVSGLVAGERLRLHGAVSRRSRFPSLRELYSGSLGRFEPNPALRPETLLGLEGGATWQAGALEAQAVGFHHRLRDAIVRVGAGGGRFRRDNRDQIRSTGVELLAAWSRGGASLSADLLAQRVRVVDPAAPREQRRPEHQPELRAGLDAALPLALGVRGSVGAEITGRQFCVHPEQRRDVELAGSGRVDVGAERAWRAGGRRPALRASVALDNATDAANFDQCGLPQPGRTLRFTVEIG